MFPLRWVFLDYSIPSHSPHAGHPLSLLVLKSWPLGSQVACGEVLPPSGPTWS